MWELFDFEIDRAGLFQNQRGLNDTIFDLMAGAIVAIVAFALFPRHTINKTI